MAAMLAVVALASCRREPPLHLHEDAKIDIAIPIVNFDLDVYWDYELDYGDHYDWRAEWFYGWDETDRRLFGDLGYHCPNVFQIRRYHNGSTPGPHQRVYPAMIQGTHHEAEYPWGYWDLLVWNEVEAQGGVQSIHIEEPSHLEYVVAFTNETTKTAHYNKTRSRSFHQPEELFAAYEADIPITSNLEGFVYDTERGVWVKHMNLILEPITYIYLPQVIIHHNNGKIDGCDGESNLSGMARKVKINDGVTDSEPVTVFHYMRMKKQCDMRGESVDIIGGKLLTFGMCNVNANRVGRGESRVDDGERHYLGLNLLFSNGNDSTFVFDVTDQVQRRYKGGVLTVELDCDTIHFPSAGGAMFNPEVKDVEDGGTHEFEM